MGLCYSSHDANGDVNNGSSMIGRESAKKDFLGTNSFTFSITCIFTPLLPFSLSLDTFIVSNKSNELLFLLESSGHVENVNDNVQDKLLYSKVAIKEQFVGCVMTDFMSMILSTHLIPAFKQANIK